VNDRRTSDIGRHAGEMNPYLLIHGCIPDAVFGYWCCGVKEASA